MREPFFTPDKSELPVSHFLCLFLFRLTPTLHLECIPISMSMCVDCTIKIYGLKYFFGVTSVQHQISHSRLSIFWVGEEEKIVSMACRRTAIKWPVVCIVDFDLMKLNELSYAYAVEIISHTSTLFCLLISMYVNGIN